MKSTIRYGVFETNSSSVHSLTICTKEQWDAWRKEEVFLNDSPRWNKLPEFVTKEELLKHCENDEDAMYDELCEGDFYTHDRFFGNEYLEFYDEHFTTPSGDEMVAFGKYGYDG